MPMRRRYLVELLTALGLIVAPFILPHLDFAPNTVNRILVWGLFGIGFDILFGYTGLLSFGQSAFYGTGGFVAAYLLTRGLSERVPGADHRHDLGRRRRVSGRTDRAAPHRDLFRYDHGGDRRDVLLRRVQSAGGLDRRRERPARRAYAELQPRLHHLHFTSGWSLYPVPCVVLFRRHSHCAAHRALAGRRRSLPRSARIRCGRGGRPQHPVATSSRRS